jgi:L-asparaginase II
MKPRSSAIVEVTRGHDGTEHVESVHKLDIVVADASGKIVNAWGEPGRKVFPRSAIKALQALALVESGAADKFALTTSHLAIACSSHFGEPFHTKAASEILAKAGLDGTCLECGAQLPHHRRDMDRLVAEGKPVTALHNNCSGKHSGFLAFAAHQGLPVKGYVKFGHTVQKKIAGILESATGAKHGKDNYGIDGCSIPTYEIPLDSLAIAFAKFGVGESEGKERSAAMIRLRDACMAHPEMIAGTGGFDTELMQAMKGRVFVKYGAEAVHTISVPELGFGAAIKCHDGSQRATESACAALVESLLQQTESGLSPTEAKALKRLANPVLKNRNGIEVGQVRAKLH